MHGSHQVACWGLGRKSLRNFSSRGHRERQEIDSCHPSYSFFAPPIQCRHHAAVVFWASSFRGVGAEVARARTCHQETSKIESRGRADSGHR